MPYENYCDADETRICYRCIDDEFLSDVVRGEGHSKKCSYCQKRRKSVTLRTLSIQVHNVFENHFAMTPDSLDGLEWIMIKESDLDWERSGELVVNIICEISGVEEQIATDIRRFLSDEYGYTAVKDGDIDPYASDQMYSPRSPDDFEFSDNWDFFCRDVQTKSRFFNGEAEVSLDAIFGNLSAYKTFSGNPVLKKINPDSVERFIYRARVAKSTTALEQIVKFPARELSAPPYRMASAGRMNAAGISVFYGAFDAETCIAEIRPPVGSRVISAKFEILKPVTLLDLDALRDIYVRGSHFDPAYSENVGRAAFFAKLVAIISRPVMPQDEILDYIPTQVIADYLAQKSNPTVDGIIFRSSQTAGKTRNVVLFQHATITEGDGIPPGTQIDVMADFGPDDDYDPTIVVFEKRPNIALIAEVSGEIDQIFETDDVEYNDFYQAGEGTIAAEATLRLVENSVECHEISGVKHTYYSNLVMRNISNIDNQEN